MLDKSRGSSLEEKYNTYSNDSSISYNRRSKYINIL